MSITYALYRSQRLLHSIGEGRVDDEQLLEYYRQALEEERFSGLTRELVDGRGITEMQITADGQREVATLLQRYPEQLNGMAIALVASENVVFGMFRMWEAQVSDLPIRVRVFRDPEAAQEWLGIPRADFIV